jgi:hypothetical protein
MLGELAGGYRGTRTYYLATGILAGLWKDDHTGRDSRQVSARSIEGGGLCNRLRDPWHFRTAKKKLQTKGRRQRAIAG